MNLRQFVSILILLLCVSSQLFAQNKLNCKIVFESNCKTSGDSVKFNDTINVVFVSQFNEPLKLYLNKTLWIEEMFQTDALTGFVNMDLSFSPKSFIKMYNLKLTDQKNNYIELQLESKYPFVYFSKQNDNWTITYSYCDWLFK